MLGSEVIDRTYETILYPAGVNRPTQDTLAETIDSSQITLKLGGRISSVPRDSILEIEDEAVSVNSVSGVDVTLFERGYLTTSTAAHDAGAIVRLGPEYLRQTVFNALNTIIQMLYSWGVYRRIPYTAATYRTDQLILLPANARRILSIRTMKTATRWGNPLHEGLDYDAYFDAAGEDLDTFEDTFEDGYAGGYSPPTPEIQLYRGGFTGGAMRIIYAAKHDRLPSPDYDLTVRGIPETVQEGLPLAIAGQLLQGREMSRLNVEEIRRLLLAAGANIPVGSTFNVANAFTEAFKKVYVAAAVKDLLEIDPTRWAYVS